MANQMNINISATGVQQAVGQMAQLVRGAKQLQAAIGPNQLARAGGGLPAASRAPRTPPDFFSRLSSAVLTTRMNFGGQGFGASPLLGRSLNVLGLKGSSAGAVGLAITALMVEFELLTLAVRTAVHVFREAFESLHAISSARMITGGTAGTMAGLSAMGMPPGMIQGLAAGLRGALTSSPLAMAAGARAGMGAGAFISPEIGGSTDSAGILQSALTYIAGFTKESDRLREAMRLNMESAIPLIEAYRRNKDAMDADAKVRGAIADKDTLRAADDVSAAFGRIQFSFLSVVQALGKPFLKDIAAWANLFADGLRGIAAWINQNPQILRALVDQWAMFIKGIALGLEALGVLPKGTTMAIANAFQAERDRMARDNKLADSIDNLNGTMQQANTIWGQNGIYGGGSRARGALPGGLKGPAFSRAVAGNALRLGAFSL